MKNLLTKLGLVEDDLPVTKAAKPTTAPTATPSPAAPAPSSFSFATTPAVDPAISEMLNNSIQENKLSGFDYLKFISAVEETKATGVPEEARFKMTFSTAKQLGVNKDSLLKSGQHYIDVLLQDESDFNADCEQYEKTEVTARVGKLASIEATIADLTKKLDQLNQDRATLTQEVQEEKAKLESRKTAFRVTLDSVRSTIKNNIDKISQYL